eukprot:CAMPEP_0197072860 /NCGR_PEP_ID=MMETSP1384-20130603/210309_1 /TAXON_ID=29189 /ORGANISM="Ammonia sp." /LENGTH=542 /DNA_ID=CAMNT_0042511681 /DNA_START=243 /DNA_END=1869 /DNA_ORIENTATION=-
MAELKARAESQQRADQERRERNQQIYQKEMERIRNENAQRQRQHEQRVKDAQIAHEKRMKELKIQQKNEAINHMTTEINKLDSMIQADKTKLEQDTQALQNVTDLHKKEEEWCAKFEGYKQTESMIQADKTKLEQDTQALQNVTDLHKKEEEWCAKFEGYKQTELDIVADKIDLTKAKDAFLFADQQVKKAIHETGQVEENVGKFLELTSGLMDATIATTANTNKLDIEISTFGELISRECQDNHRDHGNTNKLDIEISTFGELISRECQDKLYVEEYFIQQNLAKFVPFLHEEEFLYLDHLICKNDEEYQEIMDILENGVKKQLALEAAKASENDGNDEEEAQEQKEELQGEALAKHLLTTWGLQQYYDAMMDDGWDDPNGWKDLTDDDLKEFIPKKGHISKFNREYAKWLKTGGGDPDDKLLKARERRLIKEICLEPNSWEKIQLEKVDGIKEALGTVCPLFCEFFSTIHKGIKQSQELLGYDLALNAQQCKAIEMVDQMPPPQKEIEYKGHTVDGEEDHDEDEKQLMDPEVVNNFQDFD